MDEVDARVVKSFKIKMEEFFLSPRKFKELPAAVDAVCSICRYLLGKLDKTAKHHARRRRYILKNIPQVIRQCKNKVISTWKTGQKFILANQ